MFVNMVTGRVYAAKVRPPVKWHDENTRPNTSSSHMILSPDQQVLFSRSKFSKLSPTEAQEVQFFKVVGMTRGSDHCEAVGM